MKLGLRSRTKLAINSLKARMRIGDYWYWLPAEEGPSSLAIRPLVYPLRYDILVRKQFFEFYRRERQAYRADPGGFVRAAQDHEYHRWFTSVLIERFEQGARGDRAKSDALFARWVHKAAALFDSIADTGFDRRFPITPFTGRKIESVPDGVEEGQRYFMGDGCHRLACLMVLGYDELPREYTRIMCFSTLQPLDNTSLLAPSMEIRWPEDWSAAAEHRGSSNADRRDGAPK